MNRKIASWTKVVPPAQFHAVLECGHTMPCAPAHWGEASKQAIEKIGGKIECTTCTRIQSDIATTEALLKKLKGELP